MRIRTCNWCYVHGDGDVQLKLSLSSQDGVLVGRNNISFQEKKALYIAEIQLIALSHFLLSTASESTSH